MRLRYLLAVSAAVCISLLMLTSSARGQTAGPAVPKWNPAQKPTMTGPINVGVIIILFPDTKLAGGIAGFKTSLDDMRGLTQEEYFKIYSNNIAWPVPEILPDEKEADIYHAPQCYGYYCKYDYWRDPIGWRSVGEGQKRESILKADALRAAKAKASAAKYQALAYSYITTPDPDPATRLDIRRYYAAACGKNPKEYPDPTAANAHPAKDNLPPLMMSDKPFDPWQYYRPSVGWGEPMWPNSSIQFDNASAGTFAHEFGHVLGAPDVYRIGRPNDGIGGTPALMTYGPTATAFSRFYHHGFVPARNYPTLTKSGTYTLYPRHIIPQEDQALGYVIPSNHPNYYYEVEYICGENPILGVGGGGEVQTHRQGSSADYLNGAEGVLISVINLGQSNYLGSPDGYYTYRPDDPWFRGDGRLDDCLFGAQFNRQEFNLNTEPSSRLPNLLDGGVVFKNITEHQGTATFDVQITPTKLTPQDYKTSLLPQVKLEPIDQLLPTSFHMLLTPKFRGEPLFDQCGMCWSTGKNPEISSDHFTLGNCNYEMYQGRAINLKPGTTYFVRGWISNVKGIRYSDELLTVKTPALASDIQKVDPLLLDSYSDNGMLHERFSNHLIDRYGNKAKDYESYAPVAVLGKLAAYYHPEGMVGPHINGAPNPFGATAITPGRELLTTADTEKPNSKSAINFGRLHWDPRESDPAWRTGETLSLFEEMQMEARICKMQDFSLGRDFLVNFDRAFGNKMHPQFMPITAKNQEEALKAIKNELINSRPVLVIESPQAQAHNNNLRIQWGLIDGFNDSDVHIDFPLDTEFLKEKSARLQYTGIGTLVVDDYDLAILTHISF